jgi:F-type H+-transporting ATPase subunit epsilon
MATISFDLVSPENLVFNDEVGMIIVPGKDGDFGVLPGHSKVMSSLRPGRVMVYGEGKNLLKAFFVSGGFAEVNPEKCIVLAESVDELHTLEKSVIEKEIQDLVSQDSEIAKGKLSIVRAKLDSLSSSFYEKI